MLHAPPLPSRQTHSYLDSTIKKATLKFNHVPHTTTKLIPAHSWNYGLAMPAKFLIFGHNCRIPIPAPKRKLNRSSGTVQYMFAFNVSTIQMVNLRTEKRNKSQLTYYHPYHPSKVPFQSFRHPLQAMKFTAQSYINPIPTVITPPNPAPPAPAHEAHNPDAKKWQKKRDAQLDHL